MLSQTYLTSPQSGGRRKMTYRRKSRKSHKRKSHKRKLHKRKSRKLRKSRKSNKPILTYFDALGRGSVGRVALFKALGKNGWIDDRISGDEFAKLKREKKLPLGSLPVITLPNGLRVSQSTAISRWAGKKSTLYPSNPNQALLVDFILETVNEISANAPVSADKSKLKKDREEYSLRGYMFKAMTALEKLYKKSNGFATNTLTIADLTLYILIEMILTNDFTYVPPSYMNKFPNLKKSYMKVKKSKLLESYLKNYSS